MPQGAVTRLLRGERLSLAQAAQAGALRGGVSFGGGDRNAGRRRPRRRTWWLLPRAQVEAAPRAPRLQRRHALRARPRRRAQVRLLQEVLLATPPSSHHLILYSPQRPPTAPASTKNPSPMQFLTKSNFLPTTTFKHPSPPPSFVIGSFSSTLATSCVKY
jgi:hypothetical protein